jgi:site-specific recombinase XerD
MGELRERMQGDMLLRGLRQSTQQAYLDCAEKFAGYYRRSPARMGAKEIREYLLYLIEERELRPSSIGVHIGALKFLYKVTLDRAEEVAGLVCPKGRQRIPQVLTPSEVELLLTAVRWIKHRAVIMVAYGAGLRAAEVCRLQIRDIDSKRMLIYVRDGKGGKDRYALLSPVVLKVLRDYYRSHPPHHPAAPGAQLDSHQRSLLARQYQAPPRDRQPRGQDPRAWPRTEPLNCRRRRAPSRARSPAAARHRPHRGP